MKIPRLSFCVGLATVVILPVCGETVWFDRVHDTEGVDSSYGGDWTLTAHGPNQQYWTTDGGVTWRDWTAADADNIAAFVSSVGLNMAVKNTDGKVAARGLRIATSGEGRGARFTTDGFSLGAAGLEYDSRDVNALLRFDVPIELTASQTWRSYNDSTKLTAGTMVQLYGDIAVHEGERMTLTLDGAGRRSPVISQGTDYLSGFGFYGSLAAVDTLVLTNGVTFAPLYTTDYPNPKLSSSSTLVLAGGSVSMRGVPTGLKESVAKTILAAGENQVRGYNAKTTVMELGTLERKVGATVDFSNDSYGGTVSHVDRADTALCGWASFARGMFACVSGGVFGQVSEKQRGIDNWATDGLTPVRATSGGTFSLLSQRPGSLRIYTDATIDLASCEVTIGSGGFMTSLSGTMTGGVLKTGAETGELFAHIYADYTLGSVLADNGDMPLVFVKSGAQSLTLTGASTYTGATYLNGGRLTFSGFAALRGPLIQQACSTLAFADGGTLKLDAAAPRVLHGDLVFEVGAKIDAALGGSMRATMAPLVTFDTPKYKTVTYPAGGEKIALNVSIRSNAEGKADRLVKGSYPIFFVTGDNAALVDALDPAAFKLQLPEGVQGQLEKTLDGLVLNLKQVPARGLVICFR